MLLQAKKIVKEYGERTVLEIESLTIEEGRENVKSLAALNHIRKAFYGFGEICNGLVRVSVLDSIADTVIDMSL